MTRASTLLESIETEAEDTLAQSFADGLAKRFEQLHFDIDEVEVVVDAETKAVFIEFEEDDYSITLAALSVDEKTPMLIVVSDDDDSLAIDLEGLNPPTTEEGYIDFSDSSWLTKRVIQAVLNAGGFLSEAKAITNTGKISQVAVIHEIPSDDELLLALRKRAKELGLDAITGGDVDDNITHIDPEYDVPVAGDSNYGLYKVKIGEE